MALTTSATRPLAAALVSVSWTLIASCSGSPGAESVSTSEPPKAGGLQEFDGCAILKPEELQRYGFPAKGEPEDQGVGQPGCEYENDVFTLGLFKAEGSNRSYWEKRKSNFAVFEPNKVGSHRGIRTIVNGAVGQGICTQYIEAGGGTVISMVTYDSDQMAGKDPCAKAMEFAEMIEPRLPE